MTEDDYVDDKVEIIDLDTEEDIYDKEGQEYVYMPILPEDFKRLAKSMEQIALQLQHINQLMCLQLEGLEEDDEAVNRYLDSLPMKLKIKRFDLAKHIHCRITAHKKEYTNLHN